MAKKATSWHTTGCSLLRKDNVVHRTQKGQILGETRMQQWHNEPREAREILTRPSGRPYDWRSQRKSWIFCHDSKNECQDVIEESAPTQTKEETTSSFNSQTCRSIDHLELLSTPIGEEGRWWYIWTNWHLMRQPLGVSSLKKREAEAVGE
jgi:hypothetical protein